MGYRGTPLRSSGLRPILGEGRNVKFGYVVTFFAPFFRQFPASAIGKPSSRPMCGKLMCVAEPLKQLMAVGGLLALVKLE
jgi:hypothetical protein